MMPPPGWAAVAMTILDRGALHDRYRMLDCRREAASIGAITMDDSGITTGMLDQAEEEHLTASTSDEALEAAAGESGAKLTVAGTNLTCGSPC